MNVLSLHQVCEIAMLQRGALPRDREGGNVCVCFSRQDSYSHTHLYMCVSHTHIEVCVSHTHIEVCVSRTHIEGMCVCDKTLEMREYCL